MKYDILTGEITSDHIPPGSRRDIHTKEIAATRLVLPLTLDELAEANEKRNDVYPGGEYCTLAFRGLEMAGEVGEACNKVKKLIRAQYGIAGNKEGVEAYLAGAIEEMADAIITVDLLRMQIEKDMGVKVDLSDAVREKFNKTSVELGLDVFL